MITKHKESRVGGRVRVFCGLKKVHGKSWTETGDLGHNERYWFKGTVIRRYPNDALYQNEAGEMVTYPHEIIIDVKLDDGTISKGHFENSAEIL